jgi:hypothetical protein
MTQCPWPIPYHILQKPAGFLGESLLFSLATVWVKLTTHLLPAPSPPLKFSSIAVLFPDPTMTEAMMAIGFAGLGFARHWRTRPGMTLM